MATERSERFESSFVRIFMVVIGVVSVAPSKTSMASDPTSPTKEAIAWFLARSSKLQCEPATYSTVTHQAPVIQSPRTPPGVAEGDAYFDPSETGHANQFTANRLLISGMMAQTSTLAACLRRGKDRGVGAVQVLVIGAQQGTIEAIKIAPRAVYHTGVAVCIEDVLVRWNMAWRRSWRLERSWGDIFEIRADGGINWPCVVREDAR